MTALPSSPSAASGELQVTNSDVAHYSRLAWQAGNERESCFADIERLKRELGLQSWSVPPQANLRELVKMRDLLLDCKTAFVRATEAGA